MHVVNFGANPGANLVQFWCSLVQIKGENGAISRIFENIPFILLSSDSDFWGVIFSLPDAGFLVMAEKSKCGIDILNALENDGTY